MKTIKDAVIELGGAYPTWTTPKVEGGLFISGDVIWVDNYPDPPIYLCKKPEFEACAKRLGYINGYRWGVEYPTNGKRPELADDVLVDYKNTFHSDKWVAIARAGQLIYEKNSGSYPVTSFRITDQRCKPADTSYLNAQPQGHIVEAHEMVDSSWHGRGELPPVGVECESFNSKDNLWYRVEILKHRTNESGNEVAIAVCLDSFKLFWSGKFRPIRTEREKVIEAAVMAVESNNSTSESIYDTLYNAGMLVLPPKKSDTED